MYGNIVFKATILFKKIKVGFAKTLNILPALSTRNSGTDRQKKNI